MLAVLAGHISRITLINHKKKNEIYHHDTTVCPSSQPDLYSSL